MVAEFMPPRLAAMLIQGGKALDANTWVLRDGIRIQHIGGKYRVIGSPDQVLRVLNIR